MGQYKVLRNKIKSLIQKAETSSTQKLLNKTKGIQSNYGRIYQCCGEHQMIVSIPKTKAQFVGQKRRPIQQ